MYRPESTRCEVRDRPALVVAEVGVDGGQDEASSAGPRILAGYIFGENAHRWTIAKRRCVVGAIRSSSALWFLRRNAVMIPVLE